MKESGGISAAKARCCACKSTNGTTVFVCCSILVVIATNTLLGQFKAAAAIFAGSFLPFEIQRGTATASENLNLKHERSLGNLKGEPS